MKEQFNHFKEKRMAIFSELVKRYWNEELTNLGDLDILALEIKERFHFDDEDMQFIREHIRVAMGLDPQSEEGYNVDIKALLESRQQSDTVISNISGACQYCGDEDCACNDICKYEASTYKRGQGIVIDNKRCLTCGQCIEACDFGALADKIEFIPLIDLLKDPKEKVYAAVAPAIVGQFGDVEMGQLRMALRKLGFVDMLEVAMFADILTIKEAFEFNALVKNEEDVFLTSCCCPVWFNLTKRNYPKIFESMSPSISPMIASGRFLKALYPGARVVFIGPCVAKKGEAKEAPLRGAIDFVITFRELAEIFKTLAINPAEQPSDEKDQASFGGRVYGRSGGVSFAVKTVVNRIAPHRLLKLKSRKVAGVKECKAVLDRLAQGLPVEFNFLEGMGCAGGCVGGPRTNIDRADATRLVNQFAEDSLILTPYDNLNIMKILKQLGITDIEDIVHNPRMEAILSR